MESIWAAMWFEPDCPYGIHMTIPYGFHMAPIWDPYGICICIPHGSHIERILHNEIDTIYYPDNYCILHRSYRRPTGRISSLILNWICIIGKG